MHDRHGSLAAALETSVLDSTGSVPAELRRALTHGGEVPAELEAYVLQLRTRASAMMDADMAAVVAAGYTEDEVYEVTVATALGEGLRRLRAGLAALDSSARRVPFAAAADEASEAEEPPTGAFTPTVVEASIPLARRGGDS